DLPARLAAHQNPGARTSLADSGANAFAAPELIGTQINQFRTVSLTRMDDHHTGYGAHQGKQSADRLNRRAGQADVVAHRVDVTALSAEVDLHVNYDKR